MYTSYSQSSEQRADLSLIQVSSNTSPSLAMPIMTPIKIRGKKKTGLKDTLEFIRKPQSLGKRPPSPVLASQAPANKTPRHAAPRSETVGYQSSLEQLPLEVLEQIFFHCLNVSLPQASTVIGLKLASHRVKCHLTRRVFNSADGTEYPCALATIFPTSRDHREAQSAILRLRWMTLPFFQKLIPDFVVKTLVRELGGRDFQWMDHRPVVAKDVEPLIRRCVEDNAHRGNITPLQELPACWNIDWPMTESSSPKPSRVLNIKPQPPPGDATNMLSIYVVIGLRDGIVTIWDPSFDENGTYGRVLLTHKRWRALCCLEGCRIPDKLLHGPWTDEKCEFLEILIRGKAKVDWIETTSGEVAKKGLLDALREHNAWAMKLLLTRLPCPPDSKSTEHYVNEESRDMNIWSPFNFREDPILGGVGVAPEYEHWRIAVIEEGCDKDVVDALLDAPHPVVDLEGTEVSRWVVMEDSRGNERATWLRLRLRIGLGSGVHSISELQSRWGGPC